jgi:hypothetical protein
LSAEVINEESIFGRIIDFAVDLIPYEVFIADSFCFNSERLPLMF